jgi:hypothetical protein
METKPGDSSKLLECIKCALRYVIRLGSKAWCEDYFETNEKGKMFYRELLLSEKLQKQLTLLYFLQFIASLFFYISADIKCQLTGYWNGNLSSQQILTSICNRRVAT